MGISIGNLNAFMPYPVGNGNRRETHVNQQADVAVSQIMNPNALHAGRLCAPVHLVMKVMFGDSKYPVFLF